MKRTQLAADFFSLVKPRPMLLAVLASAAGYFAADGDFRHAHFWGVLAGTFAVGGGANALNQCFESSRDALMERTVNRPVASGRLSKGPALLFASLISVAGLLLLAFLTDILTASIGLFGFVVYSFIYTPLKPRTWTSLFWGAIAGSTPVLMGWCAARGRLDREGLLLFALLFVWQIPHVLALWWYYRDQYRNARFALPFADDTNGKRFGALLFGSSLGLVLMSVSPAFIQYGGQIYQAAATLLGIALMIPATLFIFSSTRKHARQYFSASVIYLSGLFIVLIWSAGIQSSL